MSHHIEVKTRCYILARWGKAWCERRVDRLPRVSLASALTPNHNEVFIRSSSILIIFLFSSPSPPTLPLSLVLFEMWNQGGLGLDPPCPCLVIGVQTQFYIS